MHKKIRCMIIKNSKIALVCCLSSKDWLFKAGSVCVSACVSLSVQVALCTLIELLTFATQWSIDRLSTQTVSNSSRSRPFREPAATISSHATFNSECNCTRQENITRAIIFAFKTKQDWSDRCFAWKLYLCIFLWLIPKLLEYAIQEKMFSTII